MDFLPLSDSAARQVIDSTTIFLEYRRAKAQAGRFAGGMYWKRQGEYEYLVKTRPDNSQQRLGSRNPDTEQAHLAFTRHKQDAETRLRALQGALKEAQRLNKAVKAGRVPELVVALLAALDGAGLLSHFTVVGTHALYAYEAAAGVRIAQGALATQDVDLLWDAGRRVQFLIDIERADTSMLRLLQTVDASFQRKDSHPETAINARGFEVDFLQREPVDGDPHPFRFSEEEDDLMPIQALRASALTSAPKFEHVVISATGKMALMRTISPVTFIGFKRWLSESAPGRDPIKRRRDASQASIVQQLLDDGLLLAESGTPA